MLDKTHRRDYPLPHGYPQQIEVEVNGSEYRLGWHKRSGRYRFRIQKDRKQKTAWFGPDPAQAKLDAKEEIPMLLSEPTIEPPESRSKLKKAKDGPPKIKVKAFNKYYTLSRDPRKQYRCKLSGVYTYAGSDPDRAPDIFRDKLLVKLFPDKAPSPIVSLESAMREWMGIKELGVSVGRLSSYRAKQSVVRQLAGNLAQIPLSDWDQRDWKKLREKLAAKHSSRTLKEDAYFIRSILQRATAKYGIVTIEGQDVFARIANVEQMRVKHFEPKEIHALLAAADQQWKALILFAVNGAFEPGDLSHLTWDDLDLATGWYEGNRRKTGCWRRFKFWPETIAALNERRTLSSNSLVFCTTRGTPWRVADNNKSSMVTVFRDLMESVDVYKRLRNLYGCRHTFGHFGMKMHGNYQFSQDAVLGHRSRHTSRYYQGRIDDPYIDGRCEFVRLYVFEGMASALKFNEQWMKSPPGLNYISVALADTSQTVPGEQLLSESAISEAVPHHQAAHDISA